ncbi:MAG: response regulator [Planctomycetia bacterium]|nr:response regulator [Planctomycetia bacterium]
MPGERPPPTATAPRRTWLADLANALAHAQDAGEAAERLAEQIVRLSPGASARVYLLGPGDRCATCPRARECTTRDRCLHLAAERGTFAQLPTVAERIPRTLSPWADALGATTLERRVRVAQEIAAPGQPAAGQPAQEGDAVSLLLSLRAGAEVVGVVAIRVDGPVPAESESVAEEAAFLAGAAVRAAISRAQERRRFEQLLLVNDLGRKVNSILNLDLLLRQAVVDIQRTFGYRHVSLFLVDRETRRVAMKAESSRYPRGDRAEGSMDLGQGIVGRAARSGRTVRVDDVTAEPDYVDWWPDTRSEVAVPVRIGGVVEAVVNVESDVVAAFSEADVLVLETAAHQLAIAMENARLFGRVKESEEEYRTLVESATTGVLQVDTAGHTAYANPAIGDLTGIDRTTALSRFADPADLAVPEDRPRVATAMAAALRGERRRDLEFRAARADGKPRFVTAELQPLLSESGVRKGVLMLLRDVTREKELQSQLHQSEKLKAMGEMVSGVAHELNNPLAGILGYAQLFLSQPTEQWSRRDVEKIESNARRCKRIVENLLTFARQSRSERQRATVNEVIESVIALNEYQFRLDNVEMVRAFDPKVPAVALDVSRWQQVFINLAQNAREAMVESGAPVRRITFTTRRRADDIEIRVEDTGPGIPRHLLTRVFDPFFTTREHGTGLGLGLCYGIVTDHGGTITADSEPGKGAAITIRLPCGPAAEDAPPTPVAPRPDAHQAGFDLKVLVVDDEQVVREVVTHVLELHGYDVDTAKDSTEALEKLAANPYDAMLTDLRMPGELDGMGLHKRVRESHPELAARVIFMTGDVLENDVFRDIDALGLPYVRKPFDIRELARVVNGVTAHTPLARKPR